MKLANFAINMDYPSQQVKVIDYKSRRIRFEGTADELLDFEGCDYCYVRGIQAKDNVLILTVRSF